MKQVLKKHSINAQILTWKGQKPSKNVQSLARKKRYELLFAQSKKYKTNNILLGHHQDDLFENFFIRILRGSGLKGLISLDKKSNFYGKNLLRPLLDQKKEDLVYLSKNVFNFYVKDPSNNDEKKCKKNPCFCIYQTKNEKKLSFCKQLRGIDVINIKTIEIESNGGLINIELLAEEKNKQIILELNY